MYKNIFELKDHNDEIKLVTEIKRIRDEMDQIIQPVRETIRRTYRTVAEKLERLRAEIIKISVRIRKAVGLKSKAD